MSERNERKTGFLELFFFCMGQGFENIGLILEKHERQSQNTRMSVGRPSKIVSES
jgi:hypothetical protein